MSIKLEFGGIELDRRRSARTLRSPPRRVGIGSHWLDRRLSRPGQSRPGRLGPGPGGEAVPADRPRQLRFRLGPARYRVEADPAGRRAHADHPYFRRNRRLPPRSDLGACRRIQRASHDPRASPGPGDLRRDGGPARPNFSPGCLVAADASFARRGSPSGGTARSDPRAIDAISRTSCGRLRSDRCLGSVPRSDHGTARSS